LRGKKKKPRKKTADKQTSMGKRRNWLPVSLEREKQGIFHRLPQRGRTDQQATPPLGCANFRRGGKGKKGKPHPRQKTKKAKALETRPTNQE